jgi:hypothetical protein
LGAVWFALVAALAFPQTREQANHNMALDRVPNVINSCVDQNPQSKAKLCTSWARISDNMFADLNTNIQLNVERFGAAGVLISGKRANQEVTETYRGKITGNRIEGTLEYTYASIRLPKPATFLWSASYFYAPSENPAAGRHVYAASDTEVSIIDTANHSVNTVKIDLGGHSASAIAVSPDSSAAYISSDGDPFHPAIFLVVNGITTTVTRRFTLKDSPAPSGLSSIAVSGDGSTVYGFGWDRKHVWYALVALDARSRATKTSEELPNGNSASALLVAGSKVVLNNGTVTDLPVPSGAPALFSNGAAVSAFPDGARICSGQGVFAVGTGAALRKVPRCGPISPDGTKIYVNGDGIIGIRDVAAFPATKLDPAEAMTVVGGIAIGVTADGKTLFCSRSRNRARRVPRTPWRRIHVRHGHQPDDGRYPSVRKAAAFGHGTLEPSDRACFRYDPCSDQAQRTGSRCAVAAGSCGCDHRRKADHGATGFGHHRRRRAGRKAEMPVAIAGVFAAAFSAAPNYAGGRKAASGPEIAMEGAVGFCTP